MNDNIDQAESDYEAVTAAVADLEECYDRFLHEMADVFIAMKKYLDRDDD